MPRKTIPKQTIKFYYPNRIKVNDFKYQVLNEYRGKIKAANFFLFFHLLSEPYLQLSENKEEFIQIHSDVLRCIFRDNYKQIINELKSSNYIQVNNYFAESLHHCKSYRINPELVDLSNPFAYTEEEIDKNFISKLQTLKTINLSSIEVDEARQHIINQTANLSLLPDAEAMQYVANEYSRMNNMNPPETYFEYFNNYPLKKVGVDRFGNRLHSVITNMPKVLRKCLRFNTAPTVPVVEIDIVNSQPFFLSAVTSQLIARFVPDATAAIPIFEKYEHCADVIKFRNLCRDGKIYEYLQTAYEIDFGSICEGSSKQKRDYTKKLTYSVLFGDYSMMDANLSKNGRSELSKIKNRFYRKYKEEFEHVYSLFKEVKALQMTCTVNNKGERKQYANNCLIAQRLESGVMYSHIVQACINEGYTEIVTVHDCLIVRVDEYDKIKSLSLHEFQQLNLNPKFN